MKTLFGGTDSQSTSSSGFSQLPKELQNAWKNLGTQATNILGNANSAAPMFTLPNLGTGAQSALDQIAKGFTPDANQLQSDINMQANPYDKSVIDTINREAAGEGSQLNSYYTNAGTMGSNRGALSANDIDLSRLQQIGTFKDQEFQNALNNALQVLPALRAQSAQGAVQGGLLTQGQQVQNQQAPVSALQALAQVTGVLPQSGGSTSQSTGSSQNGIFKSIGLFG
jgi:hypothetical protein